MKSEVRAKGLERREIEEQRSWTLDASQCRAQYLNKAPLEKGYTALQQEPVVFVAKIGKVSGDVRQGEG